MVWQGQTQFGIFTLKVVDAAAVGVAAVVTTLLGFVVEFLKGRAPANRKNKAYDDADRHLGFLEKWIQLSQHATPELPPETKLQISQELQKVHERLTRELEVVHIAVSSSSVATVSASQPMWRQVMLWYRPKRVIAWLPRAIFYVTAVLSLIGLLVGIVGSDARSDSNYWLGYSVFPFFTLIFWLLSRAAD